MATSDSARSKVERANEHIHNLQAAIESFLHEGAHPYVITYKRDPKTRRLIYYLGSVKDTPVRIASIAGDALQNIRSALDHVCWQLVIANGNMPGTNTSFPIAKSATDYEAEKARKVKGMRQDAKDAIDATKPYRGGTDILWNIHALNNIDKHRCLITVGTAHRSVDLGHHTFQMLRATVAKTDPARAASLPLVSAFFKVADRQFPLKAGDELFVDGPDAEFDKNLKFGFDVAFGESGISEGESIIETLQQMCAFVDRLILSFDPLLR